MSDLTLRKTQQEVDSLIQQLGGYWPPLANLARLFEECGELARLVNQQYGPKVIKASEVKKDLESEIGDVLFLLAVLANSVDIDLESSMDSVLQKYKTRDLK